MNGVIQFNKVVFHTQDKTFAISRRVVRRMIKGPSGEVLTSKC